MSDARVVVVSKAEPNHADHKVPSVLIDIGRPMPAFDRETYQADARAFHLREAELVHGALIAALPGGTLSNLFALMAADRVSVYRVLDPAADLMAEPAEGTCKSCPNRDPNIRAEPLPTDDEIPDAEIIGFEEQCATFERRVNSAIAVLADDDLNVWRRHAIALEYLRSAL